MTQQLPEIQEFFPFWNKLAREQVSVLSNYTSSRQFKKGSVIIPGADSCLGLILVQKGRLRTFIVSDEGKEVTLYRLYPLDICLFSASCMMNSIQFDIKIETEEDTQSMVVATSAYSRLMNTSIDFANYTNELLSSRFSDVMWTLEQILFRNMDSRIAQCLLGMFRDQDSEVLTITHEAIAKDIGTAREVVTRILKYFRNEGLIQLSRGQIKLLDRAGLETLVE